MIHLTIHGLAWCWRHGHPTVGLRAADDEVFWITLSPDDAQALSPVLQCQDVGRARLYGLLQALVESLGGRVARVQLRFGSWDTLAAVLDVEGLLGRKTVLTHPVDAIVLAWRLNLPIEMDAADHQRLSRTQSATSPLDVPPTDADIPATPPASFRQFIESLDLGQLDMPPPLSS